MTNEKIKNETFEERVSPESLKQQKEFVESQLVQARAQVNTLNGALQQLVFLLEGPGEFGKQEKALDAIKEPIEVDELADKPTSKTAKKNGVKA